LGKKKKKTWKAPATIPPPGVTKTPCLNGEEKLQNQEKKVVRKWLGKITGLGQKKKRKRKRGGDKEKVGRARQG